VRRCGEGVLGTRRSIYEMTTLIILAELSLGFCIVGFFRWAFRPRRVELPGGGERHPYRQVPEKQTRTCDRCGAKWSTRP
jgi:hypothetical protein